MTRNRLGSQKGLTYIGAMVAVMLMGIALGVTGTYWSTRLQRERETELMYRGIAYRDAIRAWRCWDPVTRQPNPALLASRGLQQPVPLTSLEHLVKDPRSAGKVRYLRKLYKDPITGKDFVAISDPNEGIIGVKSSSEKKPLKQGNFPDDPATGVLPADFEAKEKYADWQFIYNRAPVAATGTEQQVPDGKSVPGRTSPSNWKGFSRPEPEAFFPH